MALWSRFFGSAGSQAVGVGLGTTAVPALLPAAQYLVNQAWHAYPDHPLLAAQVATGVAQGQIDPAWGENEARITGINQARWRNLLAAADAGPGVAQAFELWHRGILDEAGFRRAAKRQALEQEWIDALVQAHDVLLSVDQLANAVVQGHMTQDAAAAEALKHGVTRGRFDVLVENTGLPPGPETLLAWLRRGIITQAEFEQGIREGHTKVKYIDDYLEALHPVLSARDYAELHLRAWIDAAAMNAGGALTGYTPEQMDLLYKNRGRPATVHQLLVGLRRGGQVGGSTAGIPADVVDAVARSNIRPEYTNPLWHGANTYPSGFMIRGAVQAGDITAQQAHDLLYESGWPEKWIDVFVSSWAPETASGKATHVDKAKTQLWNALHRSYLAGDATDAAALDKLATIGVPTVERQPVLDVWKEERELFRSRLTPSQLKKAWIKVVTNPITNAPWTRDEVLTELLDRGWSPQDANTFLDTPSSPA